MTAQNRSQRICSIGDCDAAHVARDMCGKHYARYMANGSPHLKTRLPVAPVPCDMNECRAPRASRGMCRNHYSKWYRLARTVTCSIGDCSRAAQSRGLCDKHYRRWRKYNDPLCTQRVVTGRHPDSNGYVMMTGCMGHPNADKGGQIFEHRLVMTQILGRPLLAGETVHHRNGIKNDNRPENLELWASSHPPGQRVEDLVAFAQMILERYVDEVQALREAALRNDDMDAV